jgi:hypothetical protein
MRIAFEPGVQQSLALGFAARLTAELANYGFSDACCVGTLSGYPHVYLKCPDTPRGLIADSRNLEGWHFEWIRAELRSSVIDGLVRKARGLSNRF